MKKYLVALITTTTIKGYDIIEAEDTTDACSKFKKWYDCNGDYRVVCFGEYNETDGTIAVPLSYFYEAMQK